MVVRSRSEDTRELVWIVGINNTYNLQTDFTLRVSMVYILIMTELIRMNGGNANRSETGMIWSLMVKQEWGFVVNE